MSKLFARAQLFPRAGDRGRTLHQVAQQQSLRGVFAHKTHRIGGHFVDFAQVVQHHTRGEQIGVQRGIHGADGLRGAQHTRDVVQKATALCVMELLRRRIIQQRLARFFQQRKHQRFEFAVGNGVHPVEHKIQHILGRLRRSGHQKRNIKIVPRSHGTHPIHAELRLAVVFQHHAAHADGAWRRRVHGGIPHFGVHIARDVRKR